MMLMMQSSLDGTKFKQFIRFASSLRKARKSIKKVNLEEIVRKNEEDVITEKIEKTETDVEFNTKYRENNSLAKGKMQTIQEGQDGKQNAIIKNSI